MNADPTRPALIHSDKEHWQPSPSPTVWRKRLELRGSSEKGMVTSLVRYDRHGGFDAHGHPGGEEIFVVSGVFSDEHGDYESGTFILNPPGYNHRPFSKEGCVIFCKLRQYDGSGRWRTRINTRYCDWQDVAAGVKKMKLYEQPEFPEKVELMTLQPGAKGPHQAFPGGVEVFVISGSVACEHGALVRASWLRLPPGSELQLSSQTGCTMYLKSNHLAGREM
jgi:anti-sigma factor ChrR (cupin superfamily)